MGLASKVRPLSQQQATERVISSLELANSSQPLKPTKLEAEELLVDHTARRKERQLLEVYLDDVVSSTNGLRLYRLWSAAATAAWSIALPWICS